MSACFRIFRLLRKKIVKRDIGNVFQYGLDAPKMYETIWINPMDVEHVLIDRFGRSESGKIVPGNWDEDGLPIAKDTKLQACLAHFKHGIAWPETGIYEFMLGKINEYGSYDER